MQFLPALNFLNILSGFAVGALVGMNDFGIGSLAAMSKVSSRRLLA
jgi:hypothetical protein